MNHVSDFLKDGISVHDVLVGLKKREESFREGVSYRQRGEEMKRLFPDICNKQVEIGELHYRGFSVLPGCSTPHFVGDPVDWHANPFNDEEYVYFLNRMDHWRRMLEAYSLTGDDKFAKSSRGILPLDIRNVPDSSSMPLMVPLWPNHLEDMTAIRESGELWKSVSECSVPGPTSSTISLILNLLMKLLETYLTSVYEHAEVLYHVSPILWPEANHNHYLMENNGLCICHVCS